MPTVYSCSAGSITGESLSSFDDEAERDQRGIGRPSKAEPFRGLLVSELMAQPDVLAVELLRRAKLKGYTGGKSALYKLIKELRPERPRPIVRFEGLADEFVRNGMPPGILARLAAGASPTTRSRSPVATRGEA
jgi:hypothetical protein